MSTELITKVIEESDMSPREVGRHLVKCYHDFDGHENQDELMSLWIESAIIKYIEKVAYESKIDGFNEANKSDAQGALQ